MKDINDELSFDFTAAGITNTLSFKLDAKEYSGSELVEAIQKGINSELSRLGYEENLVKAQIGGVDTGVVGSDDANALVLMLNDEVKLPGKGEYVIDGVDGTAAFSVFYQTDGEIVTAYNSGSKDISKGVEIEDGKTDLSFTYDGNLVEVDLSPTGKYTAEEICIQLSQVLDDNEIIERKRMGTCHLDINSLAISQEKYAARALDKLGTALASVSEIRSYFGAMQNRIEHSYENNQNKAENLTAAESGIRDTDMAQEMMLQAKLNILNQAGLSLLSQANSAQERVLSLLS